MRQKAKILFHKLQNFLNPFKTLQEWHEFNKLQNKQYRLLFVYFYILSLLMTSVDLILQANKNDISLAYLCVLGVIIAFCILSLIIEFFKSKFQIVFQFLLCNFIMSLWVFLQQNEEYDIYQNFNEGVSGILCFCLILILQQSANIYMKIILDLEFFAVVYLGLSNWDIQSYRKISMLILMCSFKIFISFVHHTQKKEIFLEFKKNQQQYLALQQLLENMGESMILTKLDENQENRFQVVQINKRTNQLLEIHSKQEFFDITKLILKSAQLEFSATSNQIKLFNNNINNNNIQLQQKRSSGFILPQPGNSTICNSPDIKNSKLQKEFPPDTTLLQEIQKYLILEKSRKPKRKTTIQNKLHKNHFNHPLNPNPLNNISQATPNQNSSQYKIHNKQRSFTNNSSTFSPTQKRKSTYNSSSNSNFKTEYLPFRYILNNRSFQIKFQTFKSLINDNVYCAVQFKEDQEGDANPNNNGLNSYLKQNDLNPNYSNINKSYEKHSQILLNYLKQIFIYNNQQNTSYQFSQLLDNHILINKCLNNEEKIQQNLNIHSLPLYHILGNIKAYMKTYVINNLSQYTSSTQINLQEVLNEYVKMYQQQLEKSKIELDFNIEQNQCYNITVNQTFIHILFINIFENILKYANNKLEIKLSINPNGNQNLDSQNDLYQYKNECQTSPLKKLKLDFQNTSQTQTQFTESNVKINNSMVQDNFGSNNDLTYQKFQQKYQQGQNQNQLQFKRQSTKKSSFNNQNNIFQYSSGGIQLLFKNQIKKQNKDLQINFNNINLIQSTHTQNSSPVKTEQNCSDGIGLKVAKKIASVQNSCKCHVMYREDSSGYFHTLCQFQPPTSKHNIQHEGLDDSRNSDFSYSIFIPEEDMNYAKYSLPQETQTFFEMKN